MLGLGIVVVATVGPTPGGVALASPILEGTTFFGVELAPTPHPLPFVRAGIQGPNVATPDIEDDIILKQEQPYHPPSFFWRGIDGPDVRFPVVNYVFLTQEFPFHPGSSFWLGVPPRNVAAPGVVSDRILMVQEQPFHPLWPRPPLWPGQRFINIIGAGRGYILS